MGEAAHTCIRPFAGGATSVMPKFSHACKIMPPSSTIPAGVCQIVMLSTSASTSFCQSELYRKANIHWGA